ncbi:trypsin-like peptidase domain-containing protein [Nocardia nova]|uniref:trypsin-like peptidase domain-containing protein n=1 Tax=Nocardia nova TaxID=37330 RepID=UPI003793501D
MTEQMKRSIIATALLAGAVVLAAPAVAPADSPSRVVGPGTSLGLCTITAAGHDAAGNAVALTAGHCMFSPGQSVVAPAIGRIGHYASWTSKWALLQSDSTSDWAVIALRPGLDISTMAPNGAVIDHVGAVPAPGSRLDKYGSTTRSTSGVVDSVTDNVIHTSVPGLNGDSGSPAYQGTGLVGIDSQINPTTPAGPFWFSGIEGVLAEINSRPGIVGYGFRIG